jgi:topoisomerase-4 subunit A
MLGTNGRFYTIEAAKLPGGRGHGEPMRLFIDLEQDADIVTMFPFQGGRKFIVASHQAGASSSPRRSASAPHARARPC